MSNIPLSLYVHIPWCIKRCSYCDFNAHKQATTPAAQNLWEEEYLLALSHDLNWLQELKNKYNLTNQLVSVFFGGGTPSLFKAASIEKILQNIKQYFYLDNCEITLEANPGVLHKTKLLGLRSAGINRLSLGVQSFDDQMLRSLSRIHSAEQARQNIKLARNIFPNINLDLMYGLPGQSPIGAKSDLQQATSFAPNHISYYQLSIEPNTYFFKHPPLLPDNDELFTIYQQGIAYLARHNYQRYEVSAYAYETNTTINHKTDNRCMHNTNYWKFGDYLAIGAGAHGKITSKIKENLIIYRYAHKKNPKDYMMAVQQHCFPELKKISVKDNIVDFLLNALRLKTGFEQKILNQRGGIKFNSVSNKINQLVAQELLELQGNTIKASAKGYLYLNEIISEFL